MIVSFENNVVCSDEKVRDYLLAHHADLKEDQDASLNTIQVANLTKKNVALLRAYAKTGKAPGQFIEVMACEGGCVTGPCVHGDRSAGQKQLLKELTKY